MMITLLLLLIPPGPALAFTPVPSPPSADGLMKMTTMMTTQVAEAEENPERFLASFLSGEGLAASLRALRCEDEASAFVKGPTVLNEDELRALRAHCDRRVFTASTTLVLVFF